MLPAQICMHRLPPLIDKKQPPLALHTAHNVFP